MKVVIFSWRGIGHPLAGGAEIVTHEHAKFWVKAGHEVTLFTSRVIGKPATEIIDGVLLIRRGNDTFGVHLEAFLWYLKNSRNIDLIVDQFHGIPFFTPLYARCTKLAFIHEVAKEVWSLNPWPFPFKYIPAFFGPIFEPLIFRFLYNKTPFMTVSQSTKEELVEWGIPNSLITVVNNGVIVPKVPLKNNKESTKTAIFLGALTKDKGVEDAILAFSNIKDQGFKLWIVGKGEKGYVQYLQDLVVSKGINNRVKFWGFVSESEKFKLLGRAHILVFPSAKEGWGLVVIEAAHVGTPTIGYKVSGLKDSVRDQETGILVDFRDINQLAQSMELLLTDDTLYRRLSQNAKSWSKKFNWEESTKKSLSLLNSLNHEDF